MITLVLVLGLATTPAGVPVPTLAAAQATASGQELAGIRVAADQDRVDPALVVFDVEWIQDAPGARISVHGLNATEVIGDPASRWSESLAADRPVMSLELDEIRSGDRHPFTLDLRAVHDGRVVVVVERMADAVTYQVVVGLMVGPTGVEVSEPAAYRVSHVRHAPHDGRASRGSTLIESLDRKTATLGQSFLEDNANVAIAPDGHDECSDTGGTYPVLRNLSVNDAPAGALVTGYLIHVTVTHPVMSDLHIGFFKGFGNGNFLWRNHSGTNLDRDYTRDIYNQDLVGIGTDANDLYLLGVRDCVVTSVGTLNYWSIRVDWQDPSPTIDLVADNLFVSPTEVAPGDSTAVVYQGHVAGTGTVGGSFTTGFYLSTDATITTSDTLLDQRTETSVNNPGENFGLGSPGLQVTIPSSTSPGTYHVGMIVDNTDAIAEANEGNNTASATLTVAVVTGDPNLEAVSASVSPSSAAPGDSVILTWRGRNSGAAASGPFDWGIYLSQDSTIDPSTDTQVMNGSVSGGWAAGFDTGSVGQSVTLPSSLADGTYRIGIYFDPANTVVESNELDNWKAAAIAVSSSPTPSATRWLIPAVASTPGFGTSNWKSQVEVVNSTSTARTASLYYVARGASWPGTLLSGPISLPARQASFLDDPLLSLNPTSGLLYVDLDASGPVMTSRTYNLAGGGATYGQGIPALPLSGAAPPTELVLPMVHSIPGQFHTNLGLVQTSSGSFGVEVAVYSPGGSLLAIQTYTRSTAFDQVNDLFTAMGIGGLSVEGAWIVVRLVSGSPDFWTCYASVVDDLTGDPTFVAPVAPE